MDTLQPSPHAVSPVHLTSQLSGSSAPLVVDVRKNQAFLDSAYLLPGALRRDPHLIEQWVDALPPAGSVLLYCVHGHEVSQCAVAALRQRGINAFYLQGGIEAWRELKLPLQPKRPGAGSRWVTREHPRIDRIACPWLIRRFVDSDAQFLYVPVNQVALVAERESASAYDVGAQVMNTVFSHVGELCSFDAFIQHYHLEHDSALQRLALIVRGADTDRLDLARIQSDDLTMLAIMMPLYDALYAWCRDAVAGQDEKHNWKPT